MFVSHETYTPARGGSAAAEIHALRRVFGPAADHIVITNTKGFTGHAMGAGIEDVVAIKALETGIVPPVPNYREADPDLGDAQPVARRRLPGALRAPARGRLRLAGGDGPAALDADGRRTTTLRPIRSATRTASSTPPPGSVGSTCSPDTTAARLEVDHRRCESSTSAHPGITPRVGGARAVRRAVRRCAHAPLSAPVVAPPVAPSTPVEAPVVLRRRGALTSVAAPAVDDVLAAVTAIVAEMTGYPAELLEPDLDLEADLGVDTVKQAEVFAAVRERYGVERDENLQLRDFPTLRHVAAWVRDRTGLEARRTRCSPAAVRRAAPRTAAPAVDEVLAAVTAIVAEMTGYPAELLEPDLDLEADLGVDTVKQAEVFAAVRERYGVERDENLQLRDFPTLRHVAAWVRDRTGLEAPRRCAPLQRRSSAPAPSAAPAVDEVLAAVTAIVAEMTGYPAELLEPDLDLEADLGVDTVKQAEVFAAVRERYGVERDESLQLRDFPTLRHVASLGA